MRVARACFSGGAVVQEELNRLYLGRDFDLASRYVAAQVTIFVCFGFSAALPVRGASAGRRLRASVAGARANVAKMSSSSASLSSEASTRLSDCGP